MVTFICQFTTSTLVAMSSEFIPSHDLRNSCGGPFWTDLKMPSLRTSSVRACGSSLFPRQLCCELFALFLLTVFLCWSAAGLFLSWVPSYLLASHAKSDFPLRTASSHLYPFAWVHSGFPLKLRFVTGMIIRTSPYNMQSVRRQWMPVFASRVLLHQESVCNIFSKQSSCPSHWFVFSLHSQRRWPRFSVCRFSERTYFGLDNGNEDAWRSKHLCLGSAKESME